MSVSIQLLKASDIPIITVVPSFLNFHASAPYFQKLLDKQQKGEITFLAAHAGKIITGFLYINWQAGYPPFAEQGIPEIRDLRVLAEYRCRGVATALMDEAEKRIFEKSRFAGLGVGLYADYGPAQQMYVRRGYVPDGRGIWHKNQQVMPGHDVFVDDDLLLYFMKERRDPL
jgi:GNAT superfamily N-acetyltransferase